MSCLGTGKNRCGMRDLEPRVPAYRVPHAVRSSAAVTTLVPGHWFLHVAWLSSGAHPESELLVSAGRGGHVHGIDFRIFEQVVELGVELGDAVSLGEVLRGAFRPALQQGVVKRKSRGGMWGSN